MRTAAVASFATVLAIVVVTSLPGPATGSATTSVTAVWCWFGLAMATRARREAARA
jgi:hypothetical protein